MIKINSKLSIPESEVVIKAVRSSVNKVATKVTLRFNVVKSASLSDEQKDRIRKKLKNIIAGDGCIVLHEETSRSQAANRRRIIDKFAALVARSLVVPKKRIPTKVSPAQKKKRLDNKKIQSKKKGYRRKDVEID
jgi:ribosome-associated protein